MAARAQIVRWGNSLAVRIPKQVAEEAKMREGDTLVLEVEAEGMVALKALDRPSLDELVARITPESVHREQSWGDAVGAELW